MSNKIGLLPFVLFFLVRPGLGDMVYVIYPDPGLDSPYGYSGTITTNGAVGSFLDASAIIDWSLQLSTPGANDGITSQVLTNTNSTVSFTPRGTGTLDIDLNSISMAPVDGNHGSSLRFDHDEEQLRFDSPSNFFSVGFVVVSDSGEFAQQSAMASIGDTNSTTIAAVPEPNAFLCLGLVGLAIVGWKKLGRISQDCSSREVLALPRSSA